MDPNILRAAITAGKAAAAKYVRENPEDENNWFPCGFANLHYKCRKNAKESAVLQAEGFRWDDYRKTYSHGAYSWTNTQSLNYKAAILTAMQNAMREAGVPTTLDEKWD